MYRLSLWKDCAAGLNHNIKRVKYALTHYGKVQNFINGSARRGARKLVT